MKLNAWMYSNDQIRFHAGEIPKKVRYLFFYKKIINKINMNIFENVPILIK